MPTQRTRSSGLCDAHRHIGHLSMRHSELIQPQIPPLACSSRCTCMQGFLRLSLLRAGGPHALCAGLHVGAPSSLRRLVWAGFPRQPSEAAVAQVVARLPRGTHTGAQPRCPSKAATTQHSQKQPLAAPRRLYRRPAAESPSKS